MTSPSPIGRAPYEPASFDASAGRHDIRGDRAADPVGFAGITGTGPPPSGIPRDPPADDGIPAPILGRKAWMPQPPAGEILSDRYRLIDILGMGGMGTVYEAEHIKIKKRVAIKVLHPELADDRKTSARFLREAQTASQLRHEHIIDITDYGESGGRVYFVMELLEGEDLARSLLQRGPFSPSEVIAISEQICDALAAAHAKGVIHRDITPANCFRVTRRRNPNFIKVLDFGIAKIKRDGQTTQTSQSPRGTRGFMALELLKGEPYDHRVDIYALGVVMYKLLSNKLPFPAPSDFGSFARQLDGHSVPLREAIPDREIPPALEAVILKALATNPDDRFQSANELQAALREIRGDDPSASYLAFTRAYSEPHPSAHSSVPSSAHSSASGSLATPPPRALPAWALIFLSAALTLLVVVPSLSQFWGLPATVDDPVDTRLLSPSEPDKPDTNKKANKTDEADKNDEASEPKEPSEPSDDPRVPPHADQPRADPPTDPPAPVAETPPPPATKTAKGSHKETTARAPPKRLPRTLSHATVDAEISSLRPRFNRCRELHSGGLNTEHLLDLKFVIAADGSVRELHDLKGGGIAHMGHCALSALRKHTFPKAQNDTTIPYTLRF